VINGSVARIAAGALAACLALPGTAEARTLRFSGYEWQVKEGDGIGPGPCNWSSSNAWVDSAGYLHLKLTRRAGKWYSAEVETLKRLGFGKYQFQVIGPIDKLDKNVVLGIFNYPTPDVGPDTTHEIDVELAKWGNASSPNLNFTVWPAQPRLSPNGRTHRLSLNGTYTTHRFTWRRASVLFQSLYGHRNDDRNEIVRWNFAPRDTASYISQKAMPVHFNLWLFQGRPPSDGKEVEIVIKSFSYVP
jgi:hypothetical protein